ncbi:hypothetical protein SAMN05421820_116122 [Pedobacter steynii]|uniref:6-bladed beta-propeller protein n=1 Tax=Pedobacter steynii TaxID=430522 RepID=A0A1H0KQB7_9SPHI|nr:hypothetical protein [Pedobacter steynii]NQX43353.1 hypothetical protein [Pedobacter steynii]SDO58157.1 hypothetical protein SAMN05421820_116122 [Pedobacter steynii]
MKKKSTYLLLAGLICSLAVLIAFYYNFSANKASQKYLKQGGFQRKPLAINLHPRNDFGLEKQFYSIVGLTGDKIIIYQMGDKNLIVFNADQTKTFLKLPAIINPQNIVNVSIHPTDPQLIDIYCNNDKKIFVFDTRSQKIKSVYKFNTYFENAIPSSDSSFFAFIQGEKQNQLILTANTFDKDGNERIAKESQIIKESMTDDGMFSRFGKNLFYVNYYNNNISVIDSTLSEEIRFHTIDTITTRPNTITIRNNTITKFIKAPRPVNQLLQIADGLLFVNSYVRADNDGENDPENENDLIDVYDTKKSCKYIGTIYITRYSKEPIQDFLIQGKTLVLQYPNKTIVYDFSL